MVRSTAVLGMALLLVSCLVLGSIANAGTRDHDRTPVLAPSTRDVALRDAIYAAFPRPAGRWGIVHIVDRSARCSAPIVAHLLARRALADLDELVIIVDRDGYTIRPDVDLVHAGFRVRVLHAANAPSIIPVAAPMLVVARPDGSLAYVGGHRANAQPSLADVAFLGELRAAGTTNLPLPSIGCGS